MTELLSTGNLGIIMAALFAVSEALALIPSLKSNSVFQLVLGFLNKIAGNKIVEKKV